MSMLFHNSFLHNDNTRWPRKSNDIQVSSSKSGNDLIKISCDDQNYRVGFEPTTSESVPKPTNPQPLPTTPVGHSFEAPAQTVPISQIIQSFTKCNDEAIHFFKQPHSTYQGATTFPHQEGHSSLATGYCLEVNIKRSRI